MKNLGTMWRELPAHEKEKYTSRAAGTEIPATPGAGAGVHILLHHERSSAAVSCPAARPAPSPQRVALLPPVCHPR
jgi:hypothetical protein